MRAGSVLLAAALLGGPVPATAAVTASCSFGDDKSAFTAEASLGPGDGVVGLHGTLEIRAKDLPDDLRKLDFKPEDLTQRWLRGDDLKLVLYRLRERTKTDPQVEIEVLIDTKRASPATANYRGRYVLTVIFTSEGKDRTVTVRGRAKCSVG